MVNHGGGSPLLAFSTLACPEWPALEVVERAATMGFDGIEWRGGPDGHAGTHLPASDRRAIRDAMDARGLSAIAVTTYTDLVHPSARVRKGSVDELLGHAQVALALGAPTLRAFPGARSDDAPDEALLDRFADALLDAAGRLEDTGISIAIEPHDAFMASESIAGLLARLDHPGVGAVWDAGNTWSIGETPDEGLAALGPWLRYVQVKDGIGRLPDWRLTLLGEGEVPLGRAIELLARDHPGLPVSIEWERPWHLELPPAEVALPRGLGHLRGLYDRIDRIDASIEEAP
jgi:sugar phosphate isomerase/epimerase